MNVVIVSFKIYVNSAKLYVIIVALKLVEVTKVTKVFPTNLSPPSH